MATYSPYISLCAGIGGLDLGVKRALPGSRCVCYVEREVSAASVLAARFEDGGLDEAPIWSDLRTFAAGAWRGKVAGVIGGIPCQPWSTAGKRAGSTDERHLWPDAFRIIRDVQPAWVFIENVGGAVRELGEGIVRPDLEGIGYRTAAGIFTAQEVGAPHRRERLFILAISDQINGDGSGSTGASWRAELANSGVELAHTKRTERGQINEHEQLRRGGEQATGGLGRASSELAHAGHGARSPERRQPQVGEQERSGLLPTRVGERSEGVGDTNQPGLSQRVGLTGMGRETVSRSTWPLTWPPGPADTDAWARVLAIRPDLAPATPQPEVRGVAHGSAGSLDLSRADKLRLLGNAVVPAQAELAFRILSEHLNKGEL